MTSAMFGWPMAAAARASVLKRRSASSSLAISGKRTLMATFLPMSTFSAR
jgi:hypothetical protein